MPRPEASRPGGPPPWADLGPSILRPSIAAVRSAIERAPMPAPTTVFNGDGRASAVLAALHGDPSSDATGDGGEAHVILTRRAGHLRQHAGEVSFPGGRQEPGEDLWATALREAAEEVALDPVAVRRIGELDHLRTVTSESFIVPFVAELPSWPELRPHPGEVDAVLHVPLSELLDPEAYREERWTMRGQERSMWFFEIEGDTIWGATASMLRNLLTIVTGTFDVADRQPPWSFPRPPAG